MFNRLIFNVNIFNIIDTDQRAMENRTARLTLLIDPDKKAVFEKLCAQEDVTASQMVRKLIRDYIEQRLGPGWRSQVFGPADAGTEE